jgi:hypothetical protein
MDQTNSTNNLNHNTNYSDENINDNINDITTNNNDSIGNIVSQSLNLINNDENIAINTPTPISLPQDFHLRSLHFSSLQTFNQLRNLNNQMSNMQTLLQSNNTLIHQLQSQIETLPDNNIPPLVRDIGVNTENNSSNTQSNESISANEAIQSIYSIIHNIETHLHTINESEEDIENLASPTHSFVTIHDSDNDADIVNNNANNLNNHLSNISQQDISSSITQNNEHSQAINFPHFTTGPHTYLQSQYDGPKYHLSNNSNVYVFYHTSDNEENWDEAMDHLNAPLDPLDPELLSNGDACTRAAAAWFERRENPVNQPHYYNFNNDPLYNATLVEINYNENNNNANVHHHIINNENNYNNNNNNEIINNENNYYENNNDGDNLNNYDINNDENEF